VVVPGKGEGEKTREVIHKRRKEREFAAIDCG
jgi:hypothetical protein